MFEEIGTAGDPALVGPPPVPDDLLRDWTPTEEDERRWESQLALLDPLTRFEVEFGLPAVPSAPAGPDRRAEEAALFAQEEALRLDRVRTIAEAHRIDALLIAFDASLQDLRERFGPAFGTRAGLGAQAFFRSFGLQTGSHPNRVAHEVDTAAALRDRLPLTWSAFRDGRVPWTRAQTVVRAMDGLDAGCWAAFDATAVELAVRSSRLKDDLRKARERLQDDTAAQRARTTFERRRTSLERGPDGGAAFVAEGLAASWVPIDDALHRAAVAAHGVAGETRSIGQLRHDIALDLLDEGLRRYADSTVTARVPSRKPVDVTLVLTVPALAWLGRTTEQAQLGGSGPIDLETAKGLAGSAKSFLRVLTDPVTGVRLAMDRTVYAPPADLARWVKIRDGRSRFPGSSRPAHLSDIDHAREWHDGGPTDAANLVTLDRSSHNLKSAGLFQEELLSTGAVRWDDPWGHRFEDPPNDPLDPAPPHLRPPDDPLAVACPF